MRNVVDEKMARYRDAHALQLADQPACWQATGKLITFS